MLRDLEGSILSRAKIIDPKSKKRVRESSLTLAAHRLLAAIFPRDKTRQVSVGRRFASRADHRGGKKITEERLSLSLSKSSVKSWYRMLRRWQQAGNAGVIIIDTGNDNRYLFSRQSRNHATFSLKLAQWLELAAKELSWSKAI